MGIKKHYLLCNVQKILSIFLILFLLLSLTGCKDSLIFNDDGLTFDVSDEIGHYQRTMYYKQLTEDEKTIFKGLYHACTYGLSFFEAKVKYNEDSLQRAVDAFSYTFPWHYLYFNYNCYDYGSRIKIEQKYVDDVDACLQQNKEIEKIALKIVGDCETDYQYSTIKNIHDYLVNHVSYVEDSTNSQDLRSVFLNKETVCAGFSHAFSYLCYLAGYHCYCVHGQAINDDADHLWNIIKLKDNYYYVDVTWDNHDSSDNETGAKHFYLFQTDEMIKDDHAFDDRFVYPTCNDDTLYFYDEPGMYVDSNDYKLVQNQIIEWINNGYKIFYFKCKPLIYQEFNDWLYSDDGFVRIYREYIDRYSDIGWGGTYNDDISIIVFTWDYYTN